MARLLAARSFVVEEDVDLLHVAHRLHSPTKRSRSLQNGRVAIARCAGPAFANG
jgi:hypothetical protein